MRTPGGLTENITSTERIPGPSGFDLADVPDRIIALVIDIVLLSIVGGGLALLFGGLVTSPGSIDTPPGALEPVAFLVALTLMLGFSLVYFGYLWTAVRGTLGMKLLRLEIGEEAHGHNLSPRRALLRWVMVGIPAVLVSTVVYVSSPIAIVMGAVGLVWLAVLLYTVAANAPKQGLHDRVAHTIVVKRRRRSS